MSRRRIGYHRVIARKIRKSLEEPDAQNSLIEVCNHITEQDLAWRYHVQPRAEENVTMFLYDFKKYGDYHVGRFVRLRHGDFVTFEANNRSFEPLNLDDGSSLSEIMHFVYSPSLRVLAIDSGKGTPGVIDLFRYLNKIQTKSGYIRDVVKLDASVIGHPDIISELRKHPSVKALTVTYDNGNAIDTSDPVDIQKSLGPLSNGVGKVVMKYCGVKRGRGRQDVISTEDLIRDIEAKSFNVGAFGNVSAEVATEYGEITLRLFGDKIKEYVDMPQGYYRQPNAVYDGIITSIGKNVNILQDVYEGA